MCRLELAILFLDQVTPLFIVVFDHLKFKLLSSGVWDPPGAESTFPVFQFVSGLFSSARSNSSDFPLPKSQPWLHFFSGAFPNFLSLSFAASHLSSQAGPGFAFVPGSLLTLSGHSAPIKVLPRDSSDLNSVGMFKDLLLSPPPPAPLF